MAGKAVIAIVDDDEAVRQSLRWLIESTGLEVQTYESAAEFKEQFQPEGPTCVLLDVRMPNTSGVALLEEMAAEGRELPVIVITAYGDVPTAVRAMKAGAMDFVEKPFNDQELIDRVQLALAKDRLRLESQSERADVEQRLDRLTSRQRQVLDLIVAGRSNREIAEKLDLSERTVEVHRANIMERMEAGNAADLVRMVLQAQGSA